MSYRLNDPYNQTPVPDPPKSHHYFRNTFLSLLIVIIIGGLSYGLYYRYNHNPGVLPHTDQMSTLLVKDTNRHAKLSYEFYWKPDCSDCQKVEKAGIVNLMRSHKNLITINTTQFKKTNGNHNSSDWFIQNHIVQVPCLIARYNNNIIYVYAGTDMNAYQALLKGHNPRTNQPLNHNPAKYPIQNDFNNTITYDENNN